jgi:hypothetical protein
MAAGTRIERIPEPDFDRLERPQMHRNLPHYSTRRLLRNQDFAMVSYASLRTRGVRNVFPNAYGAIDQPFNRPSSPTDVDCDCIASIRNVSSG